MPPDLLQPPQPQAAYPPSLQDLHKAIHSVKLPKSNTAKSCSVPIDDWNTIRSLVAALVQIPRPPANSDTSDGISSLSSKLDALAAKLDSISPQNPQTTSTSGSLPSKSYASVAASPSATSLAHSHAPRNTSCDIALTPKDRRNKAFVNETHHAMQQQLNAFITGSSRLNEYTEVPFVRATAKYRNGDVRLTLQSSHAAVLLMEEADHWLPAFSSLLRLRTPTFPVVMHRVSTDFNVGSGVLDGEDEWENDIAELVRANETHMLVGDLTRVHWIGRRTINDLRKVKQHSSLVLHFTSAESANKCIVHRLALHGHLHRTEKYCPQPVQCFNCYSFGHIASQCKRTTICGTCASDHPTSDCHCPNVKPCAPSAKCSHLVIKCALRNCGGSHRATDLACPVRQSLMRRIATDHAASGPLFPLPFRDLGDDE